MSSSRSLGITIRVSTCSWSRTNPSSAMSRRRLPSKVNGFVTTPMVSAPASLASRAMCGAAPVPVPPPMPDVMNTMSDPCTDSERRSRLSSAAWLPMVGSPPAPRPRVSFSPMRIAWGA